MQPDPRDVRIAELEVELAVRDARVAELEAQLAEFGKRLEELEEKLRRNSSNSHLPPSSDGPGAAGRGTRGKKTPTGRKRGGQKGHRGAYRALLPPERVDAVEYVFADACEACAASLPRIPDVDPQSMHVL